MKYNKPIITIDTGLAEGVYAASGDKQITVTGPETVQNWGNNNGQANFCLDLQNLDLSQLTVTMTFSIEIAGGWGSNANAKAHGNTLTLNWYSAPEKAVITVQADKNFNQLKCVGISHSNG